jgi:hypothetical protein
MVKVFPPFNCPDCGKLIEHPKPSQKRCLPCANHVWNRKELKRRHDEFAKRPKRECLRCGESYIPCNNRDVFCSKECHDCYQIFIKQMKWCKRKRRKKLNIYTNSEDEESINLFLKQNSSMKKAHMPQRDFN